MEPIKNQETKDLWTQTIPSYSLLILGILFLFIATIQRYIKNDKNYNLIDKVHNTTGATIETTGLNYTGENNNIKSGVTIEIPSNPRELLDYQIEYGEGGVDYIVASPKNQPEINSKTSEENNEKMHKYLYSNRINFEIKDTSRKGYIMFVTAKPIKSISNIFIGLDGSTIGWLDKSGENRITTKKENEFLYPLSNIDLNGNNGSHFSKKLSGMSKISINAVVGEDNNKTEKIIIFFE